MFNFNKDKLLTRDESVYQIKHGIFINSDILLLPYTEEENKMLTELSKKDSLLTQEEKMKLIKHKVLYPPAIGLLFSGLSVMFLNQLDKYFNRVFTRYSNVYDDEVTLRKNKDGANSKNASNNANKANVINDLNEKAKASQSKYDYLKIDPKTQQDIQKGKVVFRDANKMTRKSSNIRSFIISTLFFLAGYTYGNGRFRVYLHEKSLRFKNDPASNAGVDAGTGANATENVEKEKSDDGVNNANKVKTTSADSGDSKSTTTTITTSAITTDGSSSNNLTGNKANTGNIANASTTAIATAAVGNNMSNVANSNSTSNVNANNNPSVKGNTGSTSNTITTTSAANTTSNTASTSNMKAEPKK